MEQNVSEYSLNTGDAILDDATILKIQEYGVETIDAAVLEFIHKFPEVDPYQRTIMLDGPCYKWSPMFINKCQVAMSTDRMTQFTRAELTIWLFFVNFENYHTHSAKVSDANGTAIGCTNPNDHQESFVVASDGKILNGKNGEVLQLCQPPGYEVESEEIWHSLDEAFMSMYRCKQINQCGNNDSMIELPCPIR